MMPIENAIQLVEVFLYMINTSNSIHTYLNQNKLSLINECKTKINEIMKFDLFNRMFLTKQIIVDIYTNHIAGFQQEQQEEEEKKDYSIISTSCFNTTTTATTTDDLNNEYIILNMNNHLNNLSNLLNEKNPHTLPSLQFIIQSIYQIMLKIVNNLNDIANKICQHKKSYSSYFYHLNLSFELDELIQLCHIYVIREQLLYQYLSAFPQYLSQINQSKLL